LIRPASQLEAPPSWERIATLEHEIEADHLALVLRSKQIPHVLVSHADTAFDGLFQMTRGWGHVEAPEAHRDEILSILNDIRLSRSDSESGVPEPPG
jgi:hypothetical protein